jgi:hypothetical protein
MDVFADVVTRYIEERGVSVRTLARTIGYSDAYVGRVIRGVRPRSAGLARRIDDALDAGGEIADAVSTGPQPAAEEVYVVPQELINDFAFQLASQYRTDRYLGSGTLIPVAHAQYKVVKGVAEAAKGTDRAALEGTAAGFAGLLGWLYQDAGKMTESAHWHDLMLVHAQRSGDVQLAAFALQAKAFMVSDTGDGAAVLDLTGEALQNRSRLAPKVMVHLLQQRAHGLSLAGGDPAEAFRLIDEAETFMDGADDGRPWGTAVNSPRFLDVRRASVATRAGLAGALDMWDDLLPDVAPGRDRGVFMTRKAQALAAAREPDEAVRVAREVILLARRTGSARMRRELDVLQDRLVPYQRQGRELREAVAGLRKGR